MEENNMLNLMKKKAGFSLIEILVVIVIIGLIAAAAIPSFMDNIEKGRASNVIQDYSTVRSGFSVYFQDVGSLTPANITITSLSADDGSTGWSGPYVKKEFPAASNPWKGDYLLFAVQSTANDQAPLTDGTNTKTATLTGALNGVTVSSWFGLTKLPLSAASRIETKIDGIKPANATDAVYDGGQFVYDSTNKVGYFLIGDDR